MTPETMPPLVHTAHIIHFLKLPISNVFIYDPADDGPECEIITRILTSHPWLGVKWNWPEFLRWVVGPYGA